MFNAEFWQEIKEKCPKGYRKFLETRYGIDNKEFTDFCYCDIESFFDEQRIIIEIYISRRNGTWNYALINKETLVNFCISGFRLSTSNEAKLAAVKKAFEIMEAL